MEDKFANLRQLGWSEELIEKFFVSSPYSTLTNSKFEADFEPIYVDSKEMVLNISSHPQNDGLIY